MGSLFIILILCASFLFNAVWSDCDRIKGPFGLTDCVRSPFFPKFQAAICLSKRMIEMSTSKRISCKGGNTKFCWYLCSATFTDGGKSVCKCDPGSKHQDKFDTPNIHCYFPNGGCPWYTKCLANKKDCPSIKKMENKCSELENISKRLSEKGYSFLKFMKSCIQKKLVHLLYPQVSMDCGKMKTKIELSTQMCLRESGNAVRYCDLEWGDILKIGTLFQGIFNHLKICGSTPYLPPWAKILEFSLKGSSEKHIDNLANETGSTLSHSFKWNESDHTRRGNMVKLTLKKGTSVDVTRVIGCSNPLCLPKHLFSLQTANEDKCATEVCMDNKIDINKELSERINVTKGPEGLIFRFKPGLFSFGCSYFDMYKACVPTGLDPCIPKEYRQRVKEFFEAYDDIACTKDDRLDKLIDCMNMDKVQKLFFENLLFNGFSLLSRMKTNDSDVCSEMKSKISATVTKLSAYCDHDGLRAFFAVHERVGRRATGRVPNDCT